MSRARPGRQRWRAPPTHKHPRLVALTTPHGAVTPRRAYTLGPPQLLHGMQSARPTVAQVAVTTRRRK
jgi:hypothetical protein